VSTQLQIINISSYQHPEESILKNYFVDETRVVQVTGSPPLSNIHKNKLHMSSYSERSRGHFLYAQDDMVLEDKRIFGNMPENFQPFFCYETKIKTKTVN